VSFRAFIEKLDEKVKELVQQNKGMFQNLGDDFDYSSIMRENGSYPKLVKLQLPRDKNGNFTSFMFDEHKEKIKINDKNIEELLAKGKVFKCIIECSKIWAYKNKVGSIWNVVQMKFSENQIAQRSTPEANVYEGLMIDD
jgi:hypothetical protein